MTSLRLTPTCVFLSNFRVAVATNCPAAQQVPAYELHVNPPNRTIADHALFDFETCPGNTVYLTVTAIRAGTLGT